MSERPSATADPLPDTPPVQAPAGLGPGFRGICRQPLDRLLLAVIVLAMVTQDGETHWMEGVMPLRVYLIMALAFYHLPEHSTGDAWLWIQSQNLWPTCMG